MPEASTSARRQTAPAASAKPQTRDLTRGPIASTLLVFALPILAGNVLQSLNGSVNAIWVGGRLGEAALTATANANNVMFALIGAVFGHQYPDRPVHGRPQHRSGQAGAGQQCHVFRRHFGADCAAGLANQAKAVDS